MLTKTDWKSIPTRGRDERSAVRAFAHETAVEFMEGSSPGDVFEVTDWPQQDGVDASRMVERVRGAMRTELCCLRKAKGFEGDINLFRRQGRLFIEREAPVRAVRPANPYPGN